MQFYEHDRPASFNACETKILHDSLRANASVYGNLSTNKDATMIRQLKRLDALTNNWVELQDIIVTDTFGVHISTSTSSTTTRLTMLAIKWFSIEGDTSTPLGFGVHIHTAEDKSGNRRLTQASLQTARPGADERTKALFHDLQEAQVRHSTTENNVEKISSRPMSRTDVYRLGHIISALHPLNCLDPQKYGRELLETEASMRRG